ncbi:MAG: AAA family ATPase [Oscillospiraceae bacterium]
MKNGSIITIGRQYGSGGRSIGVRLAEELGIPFYDQEILKHAAEESGLCEKILKNYDEKPRSFLYSIAMDPFGYALGGIPANTLDQKVYMATFDTINALADKGSCVIIGRCADYVLRDRENVLRVFLYAPLEKRIRTVMERDSLSEAEAKQKIQRMDRSRAAYYEFYTTQKWGATGSYDLCLDSELLGGEGTVDLIRYVLEQREKRG